MIDGTLNLTEASRNMAKGIYCDMLRGILGLGLLLPSVAVNIGPWANSLRDISFTK